MSAFALSDLKNCLDRASKDVDAAGPIKRILKGWGAGGYEYADWQGGFVLEFENGTFGYLSGWSDSSGWG